MVECLIKAINKDYVVVCHHPIQLMKECLKEKLLACADKNGGKFEAFFLCDQWDEQDLMELLLVCHQTQTLFLGFSHPVQEKQVHVFQNHFHAGESYQLNENTIIADNVPRDCFIQTSANLIILGNVLGCIDLMHRDCQLECTGHVQARLRFFDTPFQDVTSFSPTRFYYENQRILKEDHK